MQVALISDLSFKNKIKTMFQNFENLNKVKFHISFFQTEMEFKNSFEQKKQKDFDLMILFHSEQNPFIFNLAAKIKQSNSTSKLIFVSHSSAFAVDGYKIGLSFYLLYPFSYEEFSFAIKKCLSNLIFNSKYIVVNSNWQQILIKLSSIQFAEKLGHNVVIKTDKRTISTRMTFTEFIKNFEQTDNFVNCVRGAIVNLNWVKQLEQQNFLMMSGDRISIRRRDRKKIKKLYNEFIITKKQKNDKENTENFY